MAFRGHGGIAFVVIPGNGPLGTPDQYGTIDIAYPGGIEAGDLLILLSNEGIFNSEMTPLGWTAAGPTNTIDGLNGAHLWWKVADGSESGTLTVDIQEEAITTSEQEVVASAIIFCYENLPDADAALTWAFREVPDPTTFPAQTGQYTNISILVGITGSGPIFPISAKDPSVVIGSEFTIDARVDDSQEFTGPVTGDAIEYMEYTAASRPVAGGGAVPEVAVDENTDANGSRFWRSNNAGFPEIDEELQPYWGVLVMP